jgi:miniconductance mechanosensitive channel
MFDNALRFEGGPDWHHFHIYTERLFVIAPAAAIKPLT